MEFSFFGHARLSRAETSQRRRRAPRAFAAATSRAPLGIGRFAPNTAPSGRGKLTRLGAFAPLFQLTALSSEGAGEGCGGSALMVVNASSMDVGNAGHAKQYE